VEILDRQRVHDGFYGLDVLRLRHRRFDRSWTAPLRRELFRQRSAVVVLPYDPIEDRLVLVEQFRTGAIEGPGSPWLLEAPAGVVEPGEMPEDVARRELREECGLEALRLEPALSLFSSPGGSTERVSFFVAESRIGADGGVHGCADEDEDIRTHVLDATTAFAWLREGRVSAMPGAVALLWLELNRPRLREVWTASPLETGADPA
jgi:ADP-ribose pyrophosphatase